MSTDPDRKPGYDPEISADDPPQAMRVFNEPEEADVPLDPDTPAFDRVQDEKEIDGEYEREYNRRYVKAHGDHHGHKGTEQKAAPDPEADA